jgi:sulfite reductase beta subunit-like hemoprotein
MPPSDDPHTLGRARLSFAGEGEADEFVRTLERFESGLIGAEEWRQFRLLRGIYPQQQEGAQMLRVKIPQGALSADQLRAVAAVARRHSRGFGHITTRQNIQLHFVAPEALEPALRELTAAGLTTREACGNSVRNVTACPLAGVSPDELFDVTPYAEALTRHFLGHPLASALPRKFKIAWEGCRDDHVQIGIHDLGFRALVREDEGALRRGFRVTAGGGTAILCRDARELVPFLPAEGVLELAEAVLHVFQDLGDFEHRKRNRLKFLIESLGWEGFRERVHAAWKGVRNANGSRPRLPFDPEAAPVEDPPYGRRPAAPSLDEIRDRMATDSLRGPGLLPTPVRTSKPAAFGTWRETNCSNQKQAGFFTATVTLPLGDLTAAQMELLADLALALGDGTVRTTSEQNLVLRWIHGDALAELHACLEAASLAEPGAEGLADVVSCPGAESCRLAVTHSRGLGRLLGNFLRARPDLAALAPGLRLRASGCPNGCGRHHVADIGFQGSLRKLGEKSVPQYFVLIGGGASGIGDGASAARTEFGRVVAKVPARRVKAAVERLMLLYASQRRPGETAREFLRRLPIAEASAALGELATLDEASATPEDFEDVVDAELGEPPRLAQTQAPAERRPVA